MVDILKRALAPITSEAWAEIDRVAKRTLEPYLSVRRVVDFSGPHGWTMAALNLGRLEVPENHTVGGVTWGTRMVLPLVEVRIPFSLEIFELDNVSRGAQDANLQPLEYAAIQAATFEENAVYRGFEAGGIDGILKVALHESIPLPPDPTHYPETVAQATLALKKAGVEGPYNLVVGQEAYKILRRGIVGGHRLLSVVEDMLLGGGVHWSSALTGGLLLSARGGDFELTVGQDISIGYSSHDRHKVDLFFTESFAFRVLDPAAAVALTV